MFDPIVSCVYYLDPFIVRPIGRVQHRCIQGWWGAYGAKQMREKARSKYQEHYALVRRITPKDRLLEYKLSEGWAPLCNFLGKPVPDQDFPHLNEQVWLDEKITLLMIRGLKTVGMNMALYGFPVLVAAAMSYAFWRSAQGSTM
ncbi:MAG: hypothetical protein M1828_006221 [Chrysothrix sp. TS-e1954]|nr:MAG: hypothetical protein M1828_006221 [Chrysothrix sp. TS-e1954]